MSKRKLTYIVSRVEKSLAFEWIAARLAKDYILTFLLLNPSTSSFESFLNKQGISYRRYALRSIIDYPFAFLNVLIFLYRHKPDIVHVHLFDAQRIGLPAAWLARIRKRIYTRHTSTFHHTYQPSGIKYDRLSNWLSTHIVSVSQASDYVLRDLEHVPAEKIVKIPHGFDWQAFQAVTPERIEAVRKKWAIPSGRPVIGMISRFIEWKGIQFAIEGFAKFHEMFPNSILVLANAMGPYEKVLRGQLASMDAQSVVCIPFEEDVLALYRTFDMFVHVPVDRYVEAYGQAYVEAMFSGVPSVLTLSGIAADYVINRQHAMTVTYKDGKAIADVLAELWSNQELQRTIAANARKEVVSLFGIDQMMTSLKRLYDA